MCTTCGCGNPGGPPGGHSHDDHGHDHPHGHDPEAETRRIAVEQAILAKNDAFAASNRAWLAEHAILALNLVSSPGSGKTTLLVKTIAALRDQRAIAVIEGDQQTSQDADRIRATGVAAVQINTGKGCHLDAHMVGHALQELAPPERGILFIENVGNLVCPAPFDLGEAHKVVILSVTEGDDKPLKYPDMFAAADLMVINKVDLLPYVEFDVARCIEYARRCHSRIEVVQLSATTGAGLDGWLAWLDREHRAVLAACQAALQARLSALDAELG